MLKAIGFMMVLLGSTILDGSLWLVGLIACAVGAALMLTGRRVSWTA